MSNTAAEAFVKELVIGWGFFNGLWVYAGIDPDRAILGAFLTIFQEMGSPFGWLLMLLPLISTAINLAIAWAMGGLIGIVAIILAFLGGMFITSPIGIWLLIIGVMLGFFAVRD